MSAEWAALTDEVERWADAGRTVRLWWRDDDAVDVSAPLERLLELCAGHAVPLALAVIPGPARGALAERLGDQQVSVLQHGVHHRNRAPPGSRRSEFPPGLDLDRALAAVRAARARLRSLFGTRVEPVLVPPWNRIDGELAGRVVPGTFSAISAFGPFPRASGVRFVNTHADVIDWRGTRGFAGRERVLGQLAAHLAIRRTRWIEGQRVAEGATGLLTHHLVHDAETWSFLRELCDWVAARTAVRWTSVAALLGTDDAAGEAGGR